MYKKLYWIIAFLLFFSTMYSIVKEPTFKGTDELLTVIADDLQLKQEQYSELRLLDTIVSQDKSEILLITQLGGQQGDTLLRPRYYAYEFQIVQDNQFQKANDCRMSDMQHSNIQHFSWNRTYIVLVNHHQAAYYLIQSDKQGKSWHSIDQVPSVLTFNIDTFGNMHIEIYDTNKDKL